MATRIRQDLERAHHLMKCRSVEEDGSDYSRSLIERREDHRLWLRSEARRSLELCPRTDTRFHRPRWLACVQGDRSERSHSAATAFQIYGPSRKQENLENYREIWKTSQSANFRGCRGCHSIQSFQILNPVSLSMAWALWFKATPRRPCLAA